MRRRSGEGAPGTHSLEESSRAPAKGLFWAWLAAALGLLHAASSGYWALGGDWLLDTVGQWALRRREAAPVATALALAAAALLKAAAALIPLLAAYRRLPLLPLWRGIAWVGSIGLILYGGLNTVLGNAVLLGLIPVGEVDRTSLAGHAWLWDPLFLLWGAALLVHLLASREAQATAEA